MRRIFPNKLIFIPGERIILKQYNFRKPKFLQFKGISNSIQENCPNDLQKYIFRSKSNCKNKISKVVLKHQCTDFPPVATHKAVTDVSKIGNL